MANIKKKSGAEATAIQKQEKYITLRKQMQAGTHVRRVFDFMYQHGSITSFQAFEFLNNTRLSASVFQLRTTYGVPVVTTMMEKNGIRYGKYWVDWEVLDV